jgi:Flp pilus assembly protein CpaB
MARTEGVLGRGRFLPNGDGAARARLRTTSRAVVPSSRALVGALLLAISGVATFTAWQGASADDGLPYVVARRPLRPGATVVADDLALVSLDLPAAVAGQAFPSVDSVVGRTTFGPVGEGEILQAAQLSEVGAAAAPVEVAFALPRDRLLDGQLRPGERVDVFSSDDRGTTQVVGGAQVVAMEEGASGSLTTDIELVVTLALDDPGDRIPLIHAVRRADVTVTRSPLSRRGVD